jgi:transcriptional regulator with XRE-family HTH domain
MKREFLVDFGNVVRSQRKRLEISQEELGYRAGLHRTYVTEIEAGVRNISIDSIIRLAKGLEISLTELFERFEKGTRAQTIIPTKKPNDGKTH